MMWYAGIDWADQHHDVVVIDEQGKQLAKQRVPHSVEGMTTLLTFLRGIGDVQEHSEHLACIIEINKGLLITVLLEAGLPVYPVNPKTLEKWRKPSGAKTDAIDAFLLARKGRSDLDQLRRLEADNPLVQELKQLTRDQDGLVAMQTRLVNQLTACLKAYYPVALELFTMLQQKTTLAFLRAFPSVTLAQQATEGEIAAVLRTTKHPHPDEKARAIVQQVQQPQLHADAVTTRTKMRLLLALVGQLTSVVETIAAYDQEIERLFLTHPDAASFRALPGAGKRLAPRLLAEWGDDRTRYQDAHSVQALAGTSPVTFQSGNFAKAHRRYACNKVLRNAFQQFAWQSTRAEPWALAYYQHKRQEGKTHTVAVRALANHWVRIIFAAWSRRQSYDAAIFLAAQHAHAPRAA
jgi:transposase